MCVCVKYLQLMCFHNLNIIYIYIYIFINEKMKWISISVVVVVVDSFQIPLLSKWNQMVAFTYSSEDCDVYLSTSKLIWNPEAILFCCCSSALIYFLLIFIWQESKKEFQASNWTKRVKKRFSIFHSVSFVKNTKLVDNGLQSLF